MRRSRVRRDRSRSIPVVPPLSILLLGFSAGAILVSPAPAVTPLELPFEARALVLDASAPAEVIALADFDGDGALDLASVGETARIRYGLAGGGFGPGVAIPFALSSQGSRGLRAADLDADGASELVYWYGPAGAQVMRVHPDRTTSLFANGSQTTFYGQWPAIGDFDADGDLDLAMSTHERLWFYRFDPGDVFVAAGSIALDHSFYTSGHLVTGDFDGDGRDDIGSVSGFQFRILRFAASDFVPAITTSPLVRISEYPVAGDFDGDGRDDVAVVNYERTNAYVYRSLEHGTISLQATLPATGPRALEIADVDLDGRPDLVLGVGSARAAAILRNAGAFTFEPARQVPAGGDVFGFAVADLDGNGTAVLAIAGSSGIGVVGYPMGPEIVAPSPALAAGGTPNALGIADLDGDGDRDFAVLNRAPASITLRRTASDGASWVRSDLDIEPTPVDLAVGDLDGDGIGELLTAHTGAPPRVQVRRGLGSGAFAAPTSVELPGLVLDLQLVDADADGALDLFAVCPTQSLLRMWRGDGAGGFGPAADLPIPAYVDGLRFVEATGDGRLDLVTFHGYAGLLRVHRGTGPGVGFAFEEDIMGLGAHPTDVEPLDANADGRMDLAIIDGALTTVLLLPGLPDGGYGAPVHSLLLAPARQARSVDLDGDGVRDLVVLSGAGSTSGAVGGLHLLRSRGDGGFDEIGALATGPGVHDLVLGDVTRDSRPDILVSQSASDDVLVLPNRSAGPVAVDPRPVGSAVALRLSPVPAPARGALFLDWSGAPHTRGVVEIHDVSGRRVGVTHAFVADADGRAALRLTAPTRAGVYFVRAVHDGVAHVTKAVVLD